MASEQAELTPRLLDARDVQRITRSGINQAYQLMAAMPHIRRGRRILVRPQDLEAWLERETQSDRG